MENVKFAGVSLSDLPHIVPKIWQDFEKYPIWLFNAEMGSGKTTFIRALCQYLQVEDEAISSPSYAIANEYQTKNSHVIYHLDLYRLHNIQEAHQIGIEEYLYAPQTHCFIEWPDIIWPIIPQKMAIGIYIAKQKNKRDITIGSYKPNNVG